MAVLAWTIANVVHEGLGHGGACLLLGARPTMFNAIFSITTNRRFRRPGSV